MSCSRSYKSAGLLAIAISCFCLFSAASLAQTQASCTFSYFNPPSGYIGGFYPDGINHYDTVVGAAYRDTGNYATSFIRYSDGSTTLFKVPNAAWTELHKRNLNGTSVGAYGSTSASVPPNGVGSKGLILTAGSYSTVNFPGAIGTSLNGINKWNTIVGSAVDPNTKLTFAFRYQKGVFTKIAFPGSVQSTAYAINDNGIIVGSYQKGTTWYGYTLKNGTNTFTSLNYLPIDINNSGAIVAAGSRIYYPDGSIKVVYVPGSANTYVQGINDLGILTGGASWGTLEFQGFTAVCH